MARTVAMPRMLSRDGRRDARDPATANSVGKAAVDYTQLLEADGLQGARIGVLRKKWAFTRTSTRRWRRAIATLKPAGAEVVDAESPPRANGTSRELEVLLYEFKAGLENYCESTARRRRMLERSSTSTRRMPAQEMPYFGQEMFEKANAKGPLTTRVPRSAGTRRDASPARKASMRR